MYQASDHTFVVCAYKENPYIEETIRSLKNQTVLGSIILSTSTPNQFLQDVCKRNDIEMIVNPNPHLAGDDWNYGYDGASTPLVTLAHQDDIYEPQYLEAVLNEVNKYETPGKDVSLLFSDYYEIRNDETITANGLLKIKQVLNFGLKFKTLNNKPFFKKRVLGFGCSICCPSVTLVKPVAGKSVFDTTYKNSCDYKTWVDLASRPGSFAYIPKKLIGHRIYEESATSKNLGENIRQGEDEQILSMLWPDGIAKLINKLYAQSEKSNQL